jgi:DHA2 family multidrug resistance protein
MFYVTIPIGLLGAGLAWTSIHEEGFEPDERPVDSTGVVLLGVGMVSLQYVLEEGNRDGWFDSRLITTMLIVAVISLVTFGVHVLEAENPIVDLRVFKDRSYAAATVLNLLIGTVLFGGSFLYSLYCGAIMHYKALDIGVIFLRASWIQLFLLPIVGRLVGKVDSRSLIFFGLCGVTYSTWLNANLTPQADVGTMTLPVFIRAVSLSFCFVPLTVAALASLPPKDRGSATGLFNATRELGGSIGTAFMSTQLTANQKVHYTYLSGYVDPYRQVASEQLRTMQGGMAGRVADPVAASLGAMNGRLNAQALSMAFSDGFFALAALFALSLAIVFFLGKPKDKVDTSAAH